MKGWMNEWWLTVQTNIKFCAVTAHRSAGCRIVFTENRKGSMCGTRDPGHRRGLKQNQPGHWQQGVNLTLIIHTNISSDNPQRVFAICKHIPASRMHRDKRPYKVDSQVVMAVHRDVHMLAMDFLLFFFHLIRRAIGKYWSLPASRGPRR